MNEHPFMNLGGNKRPVDHRDHLIGSATAPVYTFKPVHPRAAPLPYYYQGKRPACGAHAGTYLKVFLNRKSSNPKEDDTPRYVWINIKRDGTSPADGTDMTSIFKTLKNYGADAFLPLGNDINLDDDKYADIRALTPAMLTGGKSNIISGYAFLTDLSFNGIKQGIDDFGAVLLLVQANAQMWTAPSGETSWKESDVLPLRPPTPQYPVVSGHFLLADSYDEKYIYGPNSFSPSWGRNGDFYFGPEYASQILEAGIAHNPAPAVVETVQTVVSQVPALIQEVNDLPSDQQPYWKAVLLSVLKSLASLLSG